MSLELCLVLLFIYHITLFSLTSYRSSLHVLDTSYIEMERVPRLKIYFFECNLCTKFLIGDRHMHCVQNQALYESYSVEQYWVSYLCISL